MREWVNPKVKVNQDGKYVPGVAIGMGKLSELPELGRQVIRLLVIILYITKDHTYIRYMQCILGYKKSTCNLNLIRYICF